MKSISRALFVGAFIGMSLMPAHASNDMSFEQVRATITQVRDANNTQERGFIGNIIANIFNTSGRIQSQFIDAFTGLTNMNIPYWNNGNFVPGALNQTEGMNGRVGIGENPHSSARVLISGSLRVNDGAVVGEPNLNLLTTGIARISGSDSILLRTNNLNRVFINNEGNVGIGTVDPTQALDVSGSIVSRAIRGLRLRQNSYSLIHANDNSNYWMLLTNSGDTDGNWNSLRPFRINLASGNVHIGNNRLNIQHGGNVGIGTNTPSQALDVAGKIRMRQQTVSSDSDDILATKGYVDSIADAGIDMQEVIDTLFDCENDFDVCFDVKSNLTVLFALDMLRAAAGITTGNPIDRNNPQHVEIFDFNNSGAITMFDASEALRFVSGVDVQNPVKVRAGGEKWLQLRGIKNRINFVKQGGDVVSGNYRYSGNVALANSADLIELGNQAERLVVAGDIRATGNIASAEPIDDDHVATKGYVDNRFPLPANCSGSNQALGWDGSSWVCNTIQSGGGGSGLYDRSEFLANGVHTVGDCLDLNGQINVDAGDLFCRFDRSSCPSGWSQFKLWSAWQPRSCGTNQASCTTCSTAFRPFSNSGAPTCSYRVARENSWVETYCSSTRSATCTASVRSQIGCY